MALIQREAQLDRLRTAFHNCGDQHGGQVCLITGGVGSGKTALLEAFADYVTQRSAHLLRAVGSRAERNLQFAVMDQLIDSSGLGRASIRQVASAVRHLARTAPPTPPGDDLAGLTTPEPEGPPTRGPPPPNSRCRPPCTADSPPCSIWPGPRPW